MAKRPALTFEAVKAAKPDQVKPEPVAEVTAAPAVSNAVKRGRKPIGDDRQFGMTLRISPALRLALRSAADQDTAKGSRVVSVHDVILKAVEADLRRRGIKLATDTSR